MDAVIAFLVHLMEALFLIGIVGSAVVILMSGVEDVHSVFMHEEPVGSPAPEV